MLRLTWMWRSITALSYHEDDIELHVLTTNAMLNINAEWQPELRAHHLENQDLQETSKVSQGMRYGNDGQVSTYEVCLNVM